MSEQQFGEIGKRLLAEGVELRRSPDGDPYKGFLSLEGPIEKVLPILKSFLEVGKGYEEKEYRLKSITREVERSFGRSGDSSVDVDILGEDEQIHMVRAIGTTLQDKIEVSFGGGGNVTLFSDMERVLKNAINKYLSHPNIES